MVTRPAVLVRAVSRSYPTLLGTRRRTILEGVELELEHGATLGLVGPNGSGKSSLMRMLAGVDRPSAGSVTVLGASPERDETKRRVGYLPEDSPFPGELHALSALQLLGSLQGVPRSTIKQRGAALLEEVGLLEHARVPLRRYSRGMKRRFGLVQALLHEPELLLLDEPTAGLDAQGYEVLERLLERARGRGTTVVLSSHQLEDVRRRSDRLAVLLGGRLAAFGETAELLDVAGRRVLEVEGLGPETVEELGSWVAEHGGALRSSSAASAGLIDLYRRYGPPAGREERSGER